eukprot:1332646-Amorphochlora_amoeboformis.AAC.1
MVEVSRTYLGFLKPDGLGEFQGPEEMEEDEAYTTLDGRPNHVPQSVFAMSKDYTSEEPSAFMWNPQYDEEDMTREEVQSIDEKPEFSPGFGAANSSIKEVPAGEIAGEPKEKPCDRGDEVDLHNYRSGKKRFLGNRVTSALKRLKATKPPTPRPSPAEPSVITASKRARASSVSSIGTDSLILKRPRSEKDVVEVRAQSRHNKRKNTTVQDARSKKGRLTSLEEKPEAYPVEPRLLTKTPDLKKARSNHIPKKGKRPVLRKVRSTPPVAATSKRSKMGGETKLIESRPPIEIKRTETGRVALDDDPDPYANQYLDDIEGNDFEEDNGGEEDIDMMLMAASPQKVKSPKVDAGEGLFTSPAVVPGSKTDKTKEGGEFTGLFGADESTGKTPAPKAGDKKAASSGSSIFGAGESSGADLFSNNSASKDSSDGALFSADSKSEGLFSGSSDKTASKDKQEKKVGGGLFSSDAPKSGGLFATEESKAQPKETSSGVWIIL